MSELNLEEWINQKPDVHAFVAWPHMGNIHGYLSYQEIKIREDAIDCWDLCYGNHWRFLDGWHSWKYRIGKISEGLMRESNATRILAKSIGSILLSIPVTNFRCKPETEQERSRDLIFCRNRPGRIPPQRNASRVTEVLKFIEDFVEPLPSLSEIVKLELDPRTREDIRAGKWDQVAIRFARYADSLKDCSDLTFESSRVRAEDILTRINVLVDRHNRQKAVIQRHVRRKPSRKENIFSLINATTTLTKIGNEITSDY